MKITCMTHLPWLLNPLLYYSAWLGCEFFSYHLIEFTVVLHLVLDYSVTFGARWQNQSATHAS